MTSHYRFLRVKAGLCYFARVWLEIDPGGETVEVVEALPERVNADAGEFNRQRAPTWVAAALDGIHQTLAHARQTGRLTTGCRVELTKLVGSVLDTREDVVACAAALATWEGLGAPGPAPEAAFDGQHWRLLFPAPVAGPVQGIAR